jgi:hypothetical protein
VLQPPPVPVAHLPGPPPVPPQPVAPQPVPVEEPAPARFRFLAPLLAAVAAVLAAGGCFLPLFHIEQRAGRAEGLSRFGITVVETAWRTRYEIAGQDAVDQPGSPVGIPLVAAIIVLAAAALLASSRPGSALARRLVAAGAVFTAGVVATIGTSGLGWSARADRDTELEVTTAAGMWLLLAAAVVAAAAAVVAYVPGLRRTSGGWADPALAYADTPTPPSGVAITLLPPEEPGPR